MAYEDINGEYQYVTTLYEGNADEFTDMTLADTIAWLQGIAAGQACPPDEIAFRVQQDGDFWDGYNRAKILIFRAETETEKVAREAEWAENNATANAQREAKERHVYKVLRAKYG